MNNKELFPLESESFASKDVKSILLQYTRYWYVFLVSSILGIGLAYLYLNYYAVPQYKVYSTMLIKDDKSGQGLADAGALSDLSTFKSNRNIDNEIQVLKSKSLMTRIISELGLGTSYSVKEQLRSRELYGSLLPFEVLTDKLSPNAIGKTFTISLAPGNTFKLEDDTGVTTTYAFGQQIHKSYGTFTIVAAPNRDAATTQVIVRFQDLQQVANNYNQAVVIQPANEKASVLTLSLVDPIPARAKDVINKLMEIYNREAIEDKNLMATNTLKFLDERLKYLTSDLSGVEKTVAKYKSVNGLTDITTQATDYTAQASTYNKQLSDWAIQIDVLESIENYLKDSAGSYSTVPSTLGIKDETLLGLIGKFNELQLERERMLRTMQPGSPLVQNIDEQLANLRLNILENLRNIKKGLQITSNNLKSSSGQFQAKLKRVPGMEREMLEINRQQSIKQTIYSYLLQKREETAISLAATSSAARVIDSAIGGDYPISPNPQIIYLTALLLALVLPFAVIYVGNLLNNKVLTQQDVASVTPTPIIGEIAHNTEGTVVVTKGNRSPIAEMFRLVRANLNFAMVGKENVVLLFTSSMSGEGKTFCSINLSASLALTNKRVLLIDLDLRDPKVSKELGLPNGLGVTDYLVSNDVAIDSIIRFSDKTPGLSIISSGPIPPNPAELLLSPKFAHLLHELKERFDYVIIDTPPVGQVADAFTLSSFVDFTIYVVRYNYTYKAQLELVRNIHKNKTLKQPMLILNDAKEKNGTNYGYGYGYGYGQKSKSPQKKVIG